VVLPGVNQLTLENKLSLLSISHRFLFDDIFHFVIQQVQSSSIPMAERIRLGDKYNITEWLSSAYVALLDRSSNDLSAEEAEALGFERVVCLYKAKCFMYQERVERAGELSADDKGSNSAKPRIQVQPVNHWQQAFIPNNATSFTFSQPSPAPVKSGKTLTPTSEVVKKFFKLK
jgi:hypothetical protein